VTPLQVAFVWHMHQPWYLWPGTREAALPFVRLHACASYYDMPWLLHDFDRTHATFNLVPSLTEQIARYARAEITDRSLELCRRDPADLEPADRRHLLTRFRTGHPVNATETSPRYAQLLHKRGLGRNAERIDAVASKFSDDELRDLQVWLNLAWCGYALRAESEVVRELRARDRGFSEDDKLALLDEMQGVLPRVLPLYRSLAEGGTAELTTSPYYHAILPLLCNMSDAERRIAPARLPGRLWREPGEARRQLVRARRHHESNFGVAPRGLWPSEGAVSDAALAEVDAAGFSWVASDEEVLAHTLDGQAQVRPDPPTLYRPYRVGAGDLAIVFRDHRLSDLIGFVYRDWSPTDAADDMMGRLRRIAAALPTAAHPPLVCVILDGENPWGWYSDGGEGFLRALYAAIETDPHIQTVTVGDYLEQFPPQERLESVFPGSWIEHSFGTWIGGEQHRRAWELLTDALDATRGREPSEAAQRAREHLMIAEGSDWFWWYSTQHYSLDANLFDALFRDNIAEVYRALGEDAPAPVGEPIVQVSEWRLDREAVGLMQPTIDGLVSSYFEWRPAALLRTSGLASTMHRSDFVVSEVYVGHDLENLWLRVDTAGTALSSLQGHELQFLFEGEPPRRLSLQWPDDASPSQTVIAGELSSAAQVAAGKVIEAGIQLGALGVDPGATVGLAVVLLQHGRPVERWPEVGFLELQLPTEDSLLGAWFV
jgi:alpha-amylase/alpha-mannosidase (GH57 family)